MRIGLITTLNTNIGDDFVRKGLCLVLQEVFKEQKIQFLPVNKHLPLTVYPAWHPIHLSGLTRYFPRGRSRARSLIERWASKLRLSRFDSCNLIVQCGAPIVWYGCGRCEWAEPLWHRVVGRLSKRIPVLNLAAGSCFPWEKQPAHITDPEDAEYLRSILGYCSLTTVRDTLARHLCISLGEETPLIPCSALLTSRNREANLRDNGFILINYMFRGGHYDYKQGIDPSVWRETVELLISRLRKRHRLAFLCHNEEEYRLASHLDSSLPRIWPQKEQEYFDLVMEAKGALCNRLHASIALAGLGIPSVAVGTDTRLLMVDAIGLPFLYVKMATADLLEEKIENLLIHRRQEQERLLALKSATFNQYITAVTETLESG